MHPSILAVKRVFSLNNLSLYGLEVRYFSQWPETDTVMEQNGAKAYVVKWNIMVI